MVLRFICIFTDFSKYLSRAYLCYILCYTLLSTQLISEDGRELFISSCWRKLIPKIIIPLEVDKGYINVTLVLWENNRISNISARAAWENWQKRLHLMWILIDEQEISKQRSCAILIPTSGPLHMLFHLPGRLFSSILPPPPPFILQDMTHPLCISTTLTFSGRPLWLCKLVFHLKKYFYKILSLFSVSSSQFAVMLTSVWLLN